MTLKVIVESGALVYLSDHSAWEIRSINRDSVIKWPKGAPVAVYRTNDSEFPYRLVLRPEKADGSIVSAKRLSPAR